jgi:hypothetical protein
MEQPRWGCSTERRSDRPIPTEGSNLLLIPHLTWLLWSLTLAGCQVFEDLSANCWAFAWPVPW